MPSYTFECESCGNFEIVQSIANYQPIATCPGCNKTSEQRVYEADLPTGAVRLADSEIKTLGHLAQRNTENFSDDHKAELYKKHNAYKHKDGADVKMPKKGMKLKKQDRKNRTQWT